MAHVESVTKSVLHNIFYKFNVDNNKYCDITWGLLF